MMRAITLAAASTAALVLAAPAAAGRVEVVSGVLTFTETTSETNDVTVSGITSSYQVTDTAGLEVGPGCLFGFDGVSCTGVSGISISTGQGDDRVSYSSFAFGASINGGPGADTLNGGRGDDWIDGGEGNDTLNGGLGNDALYGNGDNDTLNGDGGNDVLRDGYGMIGGASPFDTTCEGDHDNVNGGAGDDTADYSARAAVAVTLDGTANDGGVSTITCFFFAPFGGFQSRIHSEADNVADDVEVVRGGVGHDRLTGNGLPNTLEGGGGNDTLAGGGGADIMRGGDGDDKVDYSSLGAAAGVTVNLQTGEGSVSGDAADNLSTIEGAIGGSGNDTLVGDDLLNVLVGGPGDDSIDSRDATAESSECGAGTADRLLRDRHDPIGSGCESYSPLASAKPTITGTHREGQTLTADGTWEAAPSPAETYQWRRCASAASSCSDIASATGAAYTLTAADVGSHVRVFVTATNSVGSDSGESDATGKVIAVAPSNTALPSIAGTPRRGQTLTASTGTWSSTGAPTFEYQWERCPPSGVCAPITGATGPTHVLVLGDVDTQLRVVVTASNSGGSGSATSERTAVISDLDTTAPETTITLGPPASTTSRDASFTFSASEAGSTFECSLDGGAFSACTSPATYSSLAFGPHTFQVRGIDAAGNVDASPASAGWSVSPPVTPPPPPPVQCKVPKLKGKTLRQAKTALGAANCRVGKVTRAFSPRAKKGKVLKQSPAANRVLAKGAKVAVTVGKGPRR